MRCFIITTLFFFLLGSNSNAQTQFSTGSGDERIFINAESMSQIPKQGLIKLKGPVQILFSDNSLSCDQATINKKTFEIEARGNVLYIAPTAIISGDRLIINYKTKTGSIYNGVIKMDQVIFEGDVIHKLSDTEYEALSAEYSACTTCPPAWSFSGSSIRAQTGGYAYIKNSVLRIVKVPIFWIPYLAVPLNSNRQSGFLFPGFGYSSTSKFTVQQSFFWAINQSQDATISARYSERRGVKGLLNYRYVLTEQSHGEADFGYLKDRILAEDTYLKNNGYEGQGINRWHVRYSHKYVLPYDFIHRIDINLTSDLRYARDFPKEFPGWGDPAIENRMSLTKNTESSHYSVDSSIYVNQLKENPLADNNDSVHRFPEIRYSLLPEKVFSSPFLFNIDLRYNNFSREGYPYDDRKSVGGVLEPEDPNSINAGIYNPETDLIRTGQRIDMQPRVSIPISLGPYVEMLPALTYRETQYQFPLDQLKSTYRRLVRTDVSLRTRFSKIYGEDTPRTTRYRHEVVPEISHTSIPWVQRPAHPFFGQSDQESFYSSNTALTDNDLLQFDYHDRLYERNLVTFSLSNYLIRKLWDGDQASYRQIALFRLSQSYDYFESIKKSDPRQPWSDISALLDIRLDYFETNSLVRYYPYQNVATTSSRIKIKDPHGHYLSFLFLQNFLITKGQQVDTHNRTEDLVSSLGVNFNDFMLEGKSTYSFNTHKFSNYGYMITLRPPGNCWHITLGQERRDNEMVYIFNAAFLFDGKQATNISTNDL